MAHKRPVKKHLTFHIFLTSFFITLAATPWLNNKHTIFGEVVSGMEVIERVANIIPKDSGDRPKTDVKIKKLKISTKL